MKEILLTSEASVKGLTAISDNVESKYLLPAIREAQEIYLREIIGDPLLAKLKWCVDNDAFRGSFSTEAFNESFQADTGSNQPYKNLLDKIQYYLAYKAVAELIPKVSHKIANMGVVKTRHFIKTVPGNYHGICILSNFVNSKFQKKRDLQKIGSFQGNDRYFLFSSTQQARIYMPLFGYMICL